MIAIMFVAIDGRRGAETLDVFAMLDGCALAGVGTWTALAALARCG